MEPSPGPPYVFPERKPGEYDSTRDGFVWHVFGPTYTDGTGWDWREIHVRELVPGNIWVPIHMLHSTQIAEIEKRSRELREVR